MTYALENESEAERLRLQESIEVYSLDHEFSDFATFPYGKMLDAGCGEGAVSRFFSQADSSLSIEGIDFSDIRIKQAKNYSQDFKNINFTAGYLEKLNFDNNSFDFIVSRYVYEHLNDPFSVSKELHRVIKPGGTIRICDFDNILSGFHTCNEEFNQTLKSIENKIGVDLNIGRKIPTLLGRAGFNVTHIRVSAHYFFGEELEKEAANYKRRFEQMMPLLSSALGDERSARKFVSDYVNFLTHKDSVYFMNKFVVDAVK